MANKPTKTITWSTDSGTRIEPAKEQREQGFETGSTPPDKFLNHLHGVVFDWLTWLDGELGEGTVNGPAVLASLTGITTTDLQLGSGHSIFLNGKYFLKNIKIRDTLGTGTYNKPVNIRAIRITLIGGGGAGGIAVLDSNLLAAGSGGGSGSYLRTFITNPSSSYSYVVGDGGTVGSNGQDTEFGTFVASGGLKGNNGPESVTSAVQGGFGGTTPAAGDEKLAGNAGSPGYTINAETAVGGKGGDSAMGGAQKEVVANNSSTTVDGLDGGNYGAGGGGGATNQASIAASGGKGGQGLIIIEEYA